MSSFSRHVAANYLGRVWMAALGLVFPPIYARLLGVEGYGVVGLFMAVAALAALVDLGLSSTLQRQLAVLSASDPGATRARMRELVRTFEVALWLLSFVVAAGLWAAGPALAGRFGGEGGHALRVTDTVVRLATATLALQLPLSLYHAALLGLQRPGAANLAMAATGTVRWAGAALALVIVAPTLEVFFAWQVLGAALQTLAPLWLVRRAVGPGVGRFSSTTLRAHGTFASTSWAITALGALLTQADKFFVARLTTPAELGLYALASVAGMGGQQLVAPLFVAVFPRLSQLVARGDTASVVQLYHRASQLIAVAVWPVTAVLVLFAREVVHAWTGDPRVAAQGAAVVAVLALGTALNGMMSVPWALQLAFGQLRLGLRANLVAVLVFLPSMPFLIGRFGLVGAASSWLLLNLGYVVFLLPFVHAAWLPGQSRRWYVEDLAWPAAAAFAGAAVVRVAVPVVVDRVAMFGVVALAALAALVCSALAASTSRRWLMSGLRAR